MSSGRSGRLGKRGIGGFMESVLAMMVVVCGVLLVTFSLSFVGIGVHRDAGVTSLEDGCRSLHQQLFALGVPFFQGQVLQCSSLGLLNSSFFHCGPQVRGYCITLQDISNLSAAEVLLKVGEPATENGTASRSSAVLLSVEDRTVHAAKITVVAW